MANQACGHLRVEYQTVPIGGGATRGWWECTDCRTHFWPSIAWSGSAAQALRQMETDLTAAREEIARLTRGAEQLYEVGWCEAGHHLRRYAYEDEGKVKCVVCERDRAQERAEQAEAAQVEAMRPVIDAVREWGDSPDHPLCDKCPMGTCQRIDPETERAENAVMQALSEYNAALVAHAEAGGEG